jgi:tRNA pseudouridine13 synthase
MSHYLTSLLPGTSGTLKEIPGDFRVEEIPLYLPAGSGEHLYVTIEKIGMTTSDLVQKLSRALNLPAREIGYAGLKDARAVTVQTLSLPGIKAEAALALQIPGVRFLSAIPHRNKLRLGHLAGNRFVIRLRDVAPDAAEHALDILHVLQDLGVPNAFGAQRYGSLANSHRIGRAILTGNFTEGCRELIGEPAAIHDPAWQAAALAYAESGAEAALELMPHRCRNERQVLRSLVQGASPQQTLLGLPRPLLRLFLSAYQSSLFDRIVTMRLATLGTLWLGDLACKHVNGAVFKVEDPVVEQPRADAFEISPTGPLFGRKVPLATGMAGMLEEALLDKEKITLEMFRLGNGLDMEGERRPLRVPLGEFSVNADEEGLLLSFSLPKGSYATSVLREVMKSDGEAAVASPA